MEEITDQNPLAAIEAQAARDWGVGSPQFRWHLAFASWRCPACHGPLVVVGAPDFRRCRRCKLSWFAQFSEPDGSAKPGAMIAVFDWSDAV